jgi:hypothetical protein
MVCSSVWCFAECCSTQCSYYECCSNIFCSAVWHYIECCFKKYSCADLMSVVMLSDNVLSVVFNAVLMLIAVPIVVVECHSPKCHFP